MVIRIRKQSENSFIQNVSFMFVVYWAILVMWQNISGAQTLGFVDLIIKIGLLIYFSSFYLLRARTLNMKGLFVVLLAFSLLITASMENQLGLRNAIAYLYPVLALFLVYGFGDGMQINRSQLIAFFHCVMVITTYATIYALLFCWDQFVGALSLNSAYGNELSSFFVSNHEYGMYLVASIISAILCLRLRPGLDRAFKAIYIVAIAWFSINLILTFSRTSLLGMGVFVLTYCFCETPKARKWIVIALALGGLALLAIPALADFFYRIVLKENESSGRDALFEYGVQYFKDGSVLQKIFGHGYDNARRYMESVADHGSVHNGYLQILLYYGIVGCGSMLLFVLSQVVISLRFLRMNRFVGTVSLALALSAAAMMFTNTTIIFTSTIDSFFMTAFFIWVPKYIRNSIEQNGFFKE